MKAHQKKRSRNLFLIGVVSLVVVIGLVIMFSKPGQKKLPLLGEPVFKKTITPQGPKTDTLYPVIPPFNFTDQLKQPVSNQTYKGHIYCCRLFLYFLSYNLSDYERKS